MGPHKTLEGLTPRNPPPPLPTSQQLLLLSVFPNGRAGRLVIISGSSRMSFSMEPENVTPDSAEPLECECGSTKTGQ
jgi:hypothetical protein